MDETPGPQPEPQAEEPQLLPGGTDALDDERYGDTPGPPTTRDLSPDDNPAVEDALPDDIAAPEDKKQEGDSSGPDDEDVPEEPA